MALLRVRPARRIGPFCLFALASLGDLGRSSPARVSRLWSGDGSGCGGRDVDLACRLLTAMSQYSRRVGWEIALSRSAGRRRGLPTAVTFWTKRTLCLDPLRPRPRDDQHQRADLEGPFWDGLVGRLWSGAVDLGRFRPSWGPKSSKISAGCSDDGIERAALAWRLLRCRSVIRKREARVAPLRADIVQDLSWRRNRQDDRSTPAGTAPSAVTTNVHGVG